MDVNIYNEIKDCPDTCHYADVSVEEHQAASSDYGLHYVDVIIECSHRPTCKFIEEVSQ